MNGEVARQFEEALTCRSRRKRERRRRGIVAVAPVEINESDLLPFVRSGLPEDAARALDRKAIGKLIRKLLDGWIDAWYRHQSAAKASDPSVRDASAQKRPASQGRR